MDWFRLLKVQTQTQRQGFRLDDKDEDYVLEDESDCYDEFVKIVEKTKNSFPNAKYVKENQKPIYAFVGNYAYNYGEFVVYFESLIPKKGEIPDKVFCEAFKTYKEIADSGLRSSKFGDYSIRAAKWDDIHYIDIYVTNTQQLEAYINIDIEARVGYSHYEKLNRNIDGWRGSLI